MQNLSIMAGTGAIVGGIIMLILGVIITGVGFAITNQCSSFRGQLGSFLDSNNQTTCDFASFALIVGIFLGLVGIILIIVGAIQHATSRKKTALQQTGDFSNARPNFDSSPTSSSKTVEKIYCRYCGKERRNTGDFCSLCGRSSHTNSSTMKKCQVCEAIMSDDSEFCANCGTEFQQSMSDTGSEQNVPLQTFEEPRFGIKMLYPESWNKKVMKSWILF